MPKQIVLLGLDGAGKTTLLYRLKLPKWTDISRDLRQLREKKGEEPGDPGYHYEEFTSRDIGPYGIWDVPGTEAMIAMWPTFYRYVQISAVLFVVDAMEKDVERLTEARRLMEKLQNEDELRMAAFILIINERGPDQTAHAASESIVAKVNEVREVLRVRMFEESPRFLAVSLDCSTVKASDGMWRKVEQHIHKVEEADKDS